MTSAPSEDNPPPAWSKPLIWKASPPFHIRWIVINETPFNRTGHLKNALNEDQAVLVGKDGQEIEPSCGQALCELLDEEAMAETNEYREPEGGGHMPQREHGDHEGYRGGRRYDRYRGRGGRGRGGFDERRGSGGHDVYSGSRGEYEGYGDRGDYGGRRVRSEAHDWEEAGKSGWTGKVEAEDKMDWS